MIAGEEKRLFLVNYKREKDEETEKINKIGEKLF